MTKRITISIPDEVAARAAVGGNASRFFTDLARREIAREADRHWMDVNNVPYTEEGIRRAGAVMRDKRARMTDEAWAALRKGPKAYAAYLAAQQAAADGQPTRASAA